jgi:hypothetical protein
MTSLSLCMESRSTLSADVQEYPLGLPVRGIAEPNYQECEVFDTSEIAPGAYIKPVDDLTTLVKDKLGENGVSRFYEFRDYSDGWCMGTGKKISHQSIAQLERFVRLAQDYLPDEPSIFISEEGILQLQWEDTDDLDIEICFGPEQFEYFLESSDEEGIIPSKNISELLNKLFQTER